ncbi:MAG: ATP-binding protein [Victivallales bacterium]|nr:ATP-binding protein [Victivallales bacterium]MCF7889321.1 ATP-binding protein [Victivallales bacterium]
MNETTCTIYAICGQIGAGKTTFARKLEKETGAIRFTPDEWILELFSKLPSNEEFDDYYFRCCNIAWKIAENVLKRKISVILDFGFWKKSERDKYFNIASEKGCSFKLYHVQCNTEEIKDRLKTRNIEQQAGSIVIDEEAFDFFSPQFEPPNKNEKAEIIVNS